MRIKSKLILHKEFLSNVRFLHKNEGTCGNLEGELLRWMNAKKNNSLGGETGYCKSQAGGGGGGLIVSACNEL